jgi:hypothetical protein
VVVRYQGPAGAEENWALVGRQPGVDTFPIAASVKLPGTVHQYLEPRTDWQQFLGPVENKPRHYSLGRTTYETITTPSHR